MPCKPGVAGSIPGFSIKPLSVEPSGVPVIINTQIINPPGPVLVSTHGKATKSFVSFERVSTNSTGLNQTDPKVALRPGYLDLYFIISDFDARQV